MNTTKDRIMATSSAPHYVWGEGCDSWVLHNSPFLSVKREEMPAGSREKLHFHSLAQQFFYVLKGEAAFYLQGQKLELHAEEGLAVPAKAHHYIANESANPVSFLVISQPAADGDRTNLS